MAFHLTDDGTLDTIIRCDECGHEDRYIDDGEDGRNVEYRRDDIGRYVAVVDGKRISNRRYATEQGAERDYNEWRRDEYIQDCINTSANEHDCEETEA